MLEKMLKKYKMFKTMTAKTASKAHTKKENKPMIEDGHLSTCIPTCGMKLKDYQKEGVDWLCFNWHQHRNVLLCDEMGLGKTCQVTLHYFLNVACTFMLKQMTNFKKYCSIVFLNYLKEIQKINGPFLIAAPLSTIGHWRRETERFTEMYAVVYHGDSDSKRVIKEYEFPARDSKNKRIEGAYRFHVLITTYDSLITDKYVLSKIPWKVLIVDEAHRLKNKDCKLWTILQNSYSCEFSLLLTGTPVQNNVEELWSLLHFIDPQHFSNLADFETKFVFFWYFDHVLSNSCYIIVII
ncbi:wu:fd12d03 isoform 1 [Reticulomyxa filosa]|uniref:Wu:fd12d03 isoform 1 n=1 Tax=Reticulomyxa filosa TaxID=46433 RepID=X6M270_RETFI|nr:wu:fd12d03 isoform 1 [Reticulomyxa filosa]|eukprot:ETO07691.1 wu:fd12d03 isoform 1 [Reticulomyxa filosa]